MPTYVTVNAPNGQTTLGANVTTTPAAGTQETWTLATGGGAVLLPSGLAAGQQAMLRCGNEYVTCTAISTDSLTVLRGAEGSTVATHSSGDTITCVVTQGLLADVQATASLVLWATFN